MGRAPQKIPLEMGLAVRSCEELLLLWSPSIREKARLLSDVLEHVGRLATEFFAMYRLNQMPKGRDVSNHVMEVHGKFFVWAGGLGGWHYYDIIDWISDQQVGIDIKYDHLLAACQLALHKANTSQSYRFTMQLERFCDVV